MHIHHVKENNLIVFCFFLENPESHNTVIHNNSYKVIVIDNGMHVLMVTFLKMIRVFSLISLLTGSLSVPLMKIRKIREHFSDCNRKWCFQKCDLKKGL